jgi:hypothetical protein
MIHLYPLILALGITTEINTAPTNEPRYFDAVEGTWEATFRPSLLHLSMRVDRAVGASNYGRTYAIDELTDFRREKRAIGFELRRNAGIFRFDGAAADLRATGTFEFIPNPSYKRAAAKLGLKKMNRHHQLTYALHDVTIDELKFMQSTVNGKLNNADLVRMFDRGATPEYVRDLASVGLSKLSAETLLRARQHGVNADFVRAMRAAGLPVSLDDFIKARAAGITSEYVRDLKTVGLTNLTLNEVMALREHDVTAEYAASVYEIGYSMCDVTDLVRLRDHGITASYIKKANKQAGEQLSVSELLRYRTRGDY